MSRGRPSSCTREEREQVLALAADGLSQRTIADQVFGDERYRGRVERILRAQAMPRPQLDSELSANEGAIDDGFDALDVSVARELVARFERSLAESEEVVPPAEIERLLRIKRQLDAMETVARLRGLLRDPE